ISAIGDQDATGDIKSAGGDRWKFMLSRERIDQWAMSYGQCARCHNQPAIWLARKRSDGAFGLRGGAHIDWSYINTEGWRHRLDHCERGDAGGLRRAQKHRRSCHRRRDLLKKLDPFAAQVVFELHKASRVSARLSQAVDEAGTNRIGNDCEDD